MRVLAYCDQRWLKPTIEVAGYGADLITSPPVTAATFSSAWLSGYDVVYLDLIGGTHTRALYASAPALSLETVQEADMSGVLVVTTACYLPESDFLEAFLRAGARGVVAGEGENWGGRRAPVGAQQLAQELIRRLVRGLDPARALSAAKRTIGLSFRRILHSVEIDDALAFQLYEGEGVYDAA